MTTNIFRRLTAGIIVIVLALNLTACGKKNKKEVTKDTPKPAATAEPAENTESTPKPVNNTEGNTAVESNTPCGHENLNYVVVKEPDCTSQGEYQYVCTDCGEIISSGEIGYRHEIVTDEAVEATCQHSGLTEGSHCSICGEIIRKQEEIPKTDHLYINGYCIYCQKESPEEYVHGEFELPEIIV